MKQFTFGLIAALGLAFVGCTQSVPDAARDVREAEKATQENVKEEVRDVQDAAIEGKKNELEEKRDLEDAKKAEIDKVNDSVPAPVNP
ncbi:hypothetical protein ETAA8_05370 [Anatilimnocola aggregata]|uniref:Uncharacterized protein n=1 Tax=Anatilimnocola aggregata TaxID=2528021 RepID=A0A517Y5F5_9BACT|nr:hypothetical protein [Anatilimnocola aggregata]QDU25469.1 hypothetical protein ETAA8_05370 [Anatilimnocola aggregata]